MKNYLIKTLLNKIFPKLMILSFKTILKDISRILKRFQN